MKHVRAVAQCLCEVRYITRVVRGPEAPRELVIVLVLLSVVVSVLGYINLL